MHPNEDYRPRQYIEDLNKTFLFPPGTGGSYSSDGFVLLGMVTAALTGKTSWAQLDQRAVLAGLPRSLAAAFNRTVFPKTGKCSSYPGIAHQYCYNPKLEAGRGLPRLLPRRAAAELALRVVVGGDDPLDDADGKGLFCLRPSTWLPGVAVKGDKIPFDFTTKTAEGCCAAANRAPLNLYSSSWTWEEATGACHLWFEEYSRVNSSGSTTGPVAAPSIALSDFTDLWEDSCLNASVAFF